MRFDPHRRFMKQPKMLTIPQAAERVGVGETIIRRHVRNKEIPSYKIGSGLHRETIRIDEKDLLVWLKGKKQ